MTQYFEIRNAAAPGGEVIALWKKEKANHHLEIMGAEAWMSVGINKDLVKETTEEEFSVMDAICEIPHIIPDGVYHFLGELTFVHIEGYSSGPNSNKPETYKTKVYAVVVDLDNPQDADRFLADNSIDNMDDISVAEAYDN